MPAVNEGFHKQARGALLREHVDSPRCAAYIDFGEFTEEEVWTRGARALSSRSIDFLL